MRFKEIIEKRTLDDIRKIFHEATGLTISLCDIGETGAIDFYPEEERGKFCKVIQSTDEGARRCLESDSRAIKEASKKQEPEIYICHAGLVNVAMSLKVRGKQIGSVITGQLLCEPPSEDHFKEVKKRVKELTLNMAELKKSYMKIKVFPKDKLDLAVKLISLISSYIIEMELSYSLEKRLLREQKKLIEKTKEEEKLRMELKRAMPFLSLDDLSSDSKMRNKRMVKVAKEFMEKNYSEPINLDMISQAVFLSPNYFSSFFKENTGYNVSEYLIRVRIEKAKELLKNFKLTVSKVAELVGYEDSNYFNQLFKKVEGIPPGEYRKKVSPSGKKSETP